MELSKTERLLSKLFRLEIISREGYPEEYLYRWHVLKTKWFKVYLHCFKGPDRDQHVHDHPWDSWIFMLRGSYREVFENNHNTEYFRCAPSFRKMKAEATHKIVRIVNGPVWTLFITGKKKRSWGFQTPEGWVYWKDYLNV